MKFIQITILLLLSLSSSAQDWIFHKASKSSDHKYEYWFRFDNKDDSCTYLLKRNTGLNYFRISLLDNNGNKVLFSNTRLKNLKSGSIETILTNEEGMAEKKLNPGKYNLTITSYLYDNFELDFEIKKNENIDLQIFLGRAPDLQFYQINSKQKLKDYEIKEIINCVKKNIQNGTDFNCSEKNKYMIVRQI